MRSRSDGKDKWRSTRQEEVRRSGTTAVTKMINSHVETRTGETHFDAYLLRHCVPVCVFLFFVFFCFS